MSTAEKAFQRVSRESAVGKGEQIKEKNVAGQIKTSYWVEWKKNSLSDGDSDGDSVPRCVPAAEA